MYNCFLPFLLIILCVPHLPPCSVDSSKTQILHLGFRDYFRKAGQKDSKSQRNRGFAELVLEVGSHWGWLNFYSPCIHLLDSRHAPHLSYVVLGMNHSASCLLAKQMGYRPSPRKASVTFSSYLVLLPLIFSYCFLGSSGYFWISTFYKTCLWQGIDTHVPPMQWQFFGFSINDFDSILLSSALHILCCDY